MDPGHVRVRPDPFVIHIRVASKIFEDFYDFGIALPLKERFFLLKPNVSCMSLQSLVITDHLVRPGQHLISKRFLN